MSDYPTESQKEFIAHIVKTPLPIDDIVGYLKQIWWHPDMIKIGKKYVRISTGGWSGNEELIEIMQDSIFWAMHWESSERGGHYTFRRDWK